MPQLDPNDLISFTDAAREKDCGRNTLYRAVEDGRLNSVEVSGRQMLVRDDAYLNFEPNWTGARARQGSDAPDG